MLPLRVHWRTLVCYSFFITVVGLHVFYRYAFGPEGVLFDEFHAGDDELQRDVQFAFHEPHDHQQCKQQTTSGKRQELPPGIMIGSNHVGSPIDIELNPNVALNVKSNPGFQTPSSPGNLQDTDLYFKRDHFEQNIQSNEKSTLEGMTPLPTNPLRSDGPLMDSVARSSGGAKNKPNQQTNSMGGVIQDDSATNYLAAPGSNKGESFVSYHPDYGMHSDPLIRRYQFGCANIKNIQIKRKLGQGVTKQVYLGSFEGNKVAVKMVTRNVIDVMSCITAQKRDFLGEVMEKHKCYTMPNMKLMKEILLLHQLEHPNLLKMLGYCVRSEETESTSLQDHGIVAVYEYGLRFYTSSIRNWPWKIRLKTALELADLLDYLHNSPLGSMSISDFKDAHFLLKDGRIKLTDLDDVSSEEPRCRPQRSVQEYSLDDSQSEPCNYQTQCVGGICLGHNARRNLDNFNKLFFRNLLFHDSNTILEKQLEVVRSRLDNLNSTAHDLKSFLYKLMEVPYIPGYT